MYRFFWFTARFTVKQNDIQVDFSNDHINWYIWSRVLLNVDVTRDPILGRFFSKLLKVSHLLQTSTSI